MKFKENLDKFGIPLMEMARIGNHLNYEFRVYEEPLMNPSFHLLYKDEFEIVLQITDYKILEVKRQNNKFQFKKNEHPPQWLLKIIKSFMDTTVKIEEFGIEGTTFQVTKFLWNLHNNNKIK